jgi:O-antigen/teichoic acid export membrane protein
MEASPADRFRRLLSAIRSTGSADPEAIRARDRYRRAALTSLSSIGVRSISIVTTLVSVPLAVNYLGVERYGLLITITSLVALLGFTDLGLGNGMLNAFVAAQAAGDRERARAYVSSAIAFVGVITVIIGSTLALISLWVSWSDVFNVSSANASAEAAPALAVFVACFLVNLPLGLVERVELGLQEGFLYNACLGAMSILGLAGFFLAIRLHAGLPWLVLALASPPAAASIVNSLSLYGRRKKWLRPTLSRVSWRVARPMLATGLMFFALQLLLAIAYSADNIVVARVLGSDAVPDLAIPFKMFNLVAVGIAILVGPLWPAYAEAVAVGDVDWVRATLRRSLLAVLSIAVPACTALVIFGDSLLDLWVGGAVESSTALLVGLGVWTVLGGTGATVAMFMNALGALKIQVILAFLFTAFNLPLSIILVSRIGVAGAIWGTVISYVVFVAIPLAFIMPRLLNTLGKDRPDVDLTMQQADQDRLYFDERLA